VVILAGNGKFENKLLDTGTNPPEVERIIHRISDYTLGYKLPGAGGGGYLYMLAKDAEAARRIKEELQQLPPNPRARFVEMSLSDKGLQISRS
jgi:mevalonate kinase